METLTVHRKKKVREFPVPSRDVTTKLSQGGKNYGITELFLPWGSLVSDISAGDGKIVNLFLRCRVVVLDRQATSVGGPVRQPYAIVSCIPQSRTNNLASGAVLEL